MKKKILSFMLAICLIIPTVFMCTGCGGDLGDDDEWPEIIEYSCTRPYHMQQNNTSYTRIDIDGVGEVKSATLTYDASDFSVRTVTNSYQAIAFAVYDRVNRAWTVSYESYAVNGIESPWFDENGMYEYHNISISILIYGTDLNETSIASIYYQGQKICDLN